MLAVNIAAMAVKSSAARACHHAVGLLGRHQFASIPHGVLLRRPVPLIPPGLEVGFRSGRQESLSGGLKGRSGFIKRRGGAAASFARPRARVEAAAPFPLIDVDRATGTTGDGADADVAIIDAPADTVRVGDLTAGEGGHGP